MTNDVSATGPQNFQADSGRRIEMKQIEHLHIFQKAAFIATTQHLLPAIREGWRAQGDATYLPLNVVMYLCAQLNLTANDVRNCWEIYGAEIIGEREREPFAKLDSDAGLQPRQRWATVQFTAA